MKYARQILSFSICLFFCQSAFAERSGWRQMHEVTAGNNRILLMEFRSYSKKGWNAQAQWRVTNTSDATLDCVGIGDKLYALDNGASISRSGEHCDRLRPGRSFTTVSDKLAKGVIVEVALSNVKFKYNGERAVVEL